LTAASYDFEMLEPRVEVRTVPPGTVLFTAPIDHCLSVHAGPAARVSCREFAYRGFVERGQINLVPVGAFDQCVQDDTSTTVDVHLSDSLLKVAAEEMGLDASRAALEPKFCFRDPQIEHIAWALEAEHRVGSANLLYRESLGLALAVHLLGRYGTAEKIAKSEGMSTPQLNRVLEWIEAHLASDVSLLRLARVAGMSASHFRVLFKRSMNVPVHEYVIRRRVERARMLLLRGDLPASQVALETGFSHQSHMARCMRRVLGITPTQLRSL